MKIFVILSQLSIIIFRCDMVFVGPRNTAVIAGQKMEMKCQVDANWTVRVWSIQRTFSSKTETIFTNWKKPYTLLSTHFGVDVDDFGLGILYTNSTVLDDAGIYTCQIQLGHAQPMTYSAHLIVFESEPVCSSNSTLNLNATNQREASVWMRCTVNFRGNLVPDVEWRLHEGDGKEFDEGREITKRADTIIIPNSTVSSELTVFLTPISGSLSYSFKIYFKSTNDSKKTTDTNAPEYSYIWNISILVVPSPAPPHSPIDLVTILTAVVASLIVVLTMTVIILCVKKRKIPHKESIPDVAPALSFQGRPRPRTVPAVHRTQHQNYFGDDGTEYLEVNTMARQPIPVRLPTETTVFSVVGEYACIDHTLSPPIPPRAKLH